MELLLSIAIISLLSSVVLASISGARKSARDARRLQDMKQIETALEMYYNDNNGYPPVTSSGTCAGHSSGHQADKEFLESLKPYMNGDVPVDPAGKSCDMDYEYYLYNSGSYGCPVSEGQFYVLGVKDMEASSHPHPESPGWSCEDRDWQDKYDWTIGKYE